MITEWPCLYVTVFRESVYACLQTTEVHQVWGQLLRLQVHYTTEPSFPQMARRAGLSLWAWKAEVGQGRSHSAFPDS